MIPIREFDVGTSDTEAIPVVPFGSKNAMWPGLCRPPLIKPNVSIIRIGRLLVKAKVPASTLKNSSDRTLLGIWPGTIDIVRSFVDVLMLIGPVALVELAVGISPLVV